MRCPPHLDTVSSNLIKPKFDVKTFNDMDRYDCSTVSGDVFLSPNPTLSFIDGNFVENVFYYLVDNKTKHPFAWCKASNYSQPGQSKCRLLAFKTVALVCIEYKIDI